MTLEQLDLGGNLLEEIGSQALPLQQLKSLELSHSPRLQVRLPPLLPLLSRLLVPLHLHERTSLHLSRSPSLVLLAFN